MLFCIALFCAEPASGQLDNNFGSTRDLLRIEGRLYQDTAWTKPLKGVDILVRQLMNGSEKFMTRRKDGKAEVTLNPEWKARYEPRGKIETDEFGRYLFHIDLQAEYQLIYSKPSYRKRIVDVVTILGQPALKALESKKKRGVIVYSVSGTLREYKEGIIGPPVEGLSSKIAYSEKLESFTIQENMQTRQAEAGLELLAASAAAEDEEELRKERSTQFANMQLTQDVVDKKIALVYGDDTINVIDSNLNRQGSWVYFGENSDDPSYQNEDKVFEGPYRDGLKEDRWVKYHPNQEKAVEVGFAFGKFDGSFKTYYENGALESEGSYDRQKDKKIKDFNLYYAQGGIKADFNYDADGKRNGQQFVYHPNGNLAVTAMFRNDTLHGMMVIMNRGGDVIERREYNNGVLIQTERLGDALDTQELDALIDLVVKDDTTTQVKVREALDDLKFIEEQYDTVLADKMKELEALRGQLSEAELARIAAEKDSERFQALNAIKEEKLQQNRRLLIAAVVALSVIGLLAFMLFRRNEEKKRTNRILASQKQEIEHQHEQLSEKNKEIMDSIAYAKRIQTAILPPDRIIKEYLSESFILYKPKDVVAGDFYWMETVDNTIYFAAADCTGHGVPGAMVSVICVNGLNRSVREFGLRDPGKILDKTRELVIKEFEKSEEEVKDGMDISLCALNTKTHELHWAGAHNPLWIVRKNGAELEEVKADKQPIGKYHHQTTFTSHTIQLESGDTIYTFSDGYPDQFGGEKGKKYKSGNFKKKLLAISKEPIEKQRQLLDDEFEAWRGELEQIDDVCVIGVRI